MTTLSFDFTSKILKEKNYPQHSHDDLEKKFNGFLSALEDYEIKGELIKSELKDLSEKFGRAWEIVSGKGIREVRPNVPYSEESSLEAAMSDTPFVRTGLNKYLRTIKANLKDVSNEKPSSVEAANKIIPIVEDMISLNNRLNELKKCVVAKKSADVEKKNAKETEMAKIASHKDTVRAFNFLSNMMEDDKQVLIDNLIKINQEKADKMVEFVNENNGLPNAFSMKRERVNGRTNFIQPEYSKAQLRHVAAEHNGFEDRLSSDNREKINLASKEEIHDRVVSESKVQAKYIIDEYIHKVTTKLGFFFSKKDDNSSLDSIEKLSIDLMGNIEARLKVSFKDKSQFDLHTQTIIASNPKSDGYHVKVPTRFTNALRPDGTKIKSPSEKRVQDELTL